MKLLGMLTNILIAMQEMSLWPSLRRYLSQAVAFFSNPPELPFKYQFLTIMLLQLLNAMSAPSDLSPSRLSQVEDQLSTRDEPNSGFSSPPGWLFKGQVLHFPLPDSESGSLPQRVRLASNIARFAGALVVSDLEDKRITHVVVDSDKSTGISTDMPALRISLSNRPGANKRIPHIVTVEWIERSWQEKTLLDEERTLSLSLFMRTQYSVS
jgi:DNA ligase-4